MFKICVNHGQITDSEKNEATSAAASAYAIMVVTLAKDAMHGGVCGKIEQA